MGVGGVDLGYAAGHLPAPRPVAKCGKSMDRFLPDEHDTMTASLCHGSSILHLIF